MIDTRLNKECPCDSDKGCELEEMTQDGYWFCLGSKCEMLVRADEREKIKEELKKYHRLEAKFTLNQCKEKDGLYYLDVTDLFYGLVDQVLGNTNKNL